MAAEADDVLRNGDIERSETFVRVGYGRLRETWERGVEEAILNETVVRFRPGVATQRLRAVVLDDEDYVKIHEAMARCSHFSSRLSAGAGHPPNAAGIQPVSDASRSASVARSPFLSFARRFTSDGAKVLAASRIADLETCLK